MGRIWVLEELDETSPDPCYPEILDWHINLDLVTEGRSRQFKLLSIGRKFRELGERESIFNGNNVMGMDEWW